MTATAPPIQPPSAQKLDVMSELAISFRGLQRDNQRVLFHHVAYQLQGTGSLMVLTVIETRGDKRTHVFHWDDVYCLIATPSVIAT